MKAARCPDDGRCHHECPEPECFRVRACGPLTGVYPRNEWPADVVAAHGLPPATPTIEDHLFGGAIDGTTQPG